MLCFVFQMIWSQFNPRNNNFFVNFIAPFDPTSPSTPVGGIIYYITPPRGLEVAALDPMRAVGYVLFYDWNCSCIWKTMG